MHPPTVPLLEHPDLQALRARYETVAETPTAQSIDGLTVLAGLYLAMSPWVTGFPSAAHGLAVTNLVTGLAVAVLGAGFAVAYGRTHGLAWTLPVLGFWSGVAPWLVLDHAVTPLTAASNVATGALVIVLGLLTLTMPPSGNRTRVVPRAEDDRA